MMFSEVYFQGEERNGFYVRPLMKRVWAAQLEILKEIDRICKKHKLKYFAYGGTLLGAVRHQGYIPWDDDMDLGMLRGDYEKFRHYAEKELPEGWFVLGTQPTVIRVMNSDNVRVDQEFLDRFHGCPFMMGVDIFCWDSIPQNKREEEAAVNLFWGIAYLAVYWDKYDEAEQRTWEAARETGVANIENITGFHFDRKGSMKEQLAYLADRVAASCWDPECKELTRPFILHERPDYRIPGSCLEKIVEVPYENTTIPIPEQYAPLLLLDYGPDYMTPVRDYFHSYPFFRNQTGMLQDIFEKQGKALPDCFRWEDV